MNIGSLDELALHGSELEEWKELMQFHGPQSVQFKPALAAALKEAATKEAAVQTEPTALKKSNMSTEVMDELELHGSEVKEWKELMQLHEPEPLRWKFTDGAVRAGVRMD